VKLLWPLLAVLAVLCFCTVSSFASSELSFELEGVGPGASISLSPTGDSGSAFSNARRFDYGATVSFTAGTFSQSFTTPGSPITTFVYNPGGIITITIPNTDMNAGAYTGTFIEENDVFPESYAGNSNIGFSGYFILDGYSGSGIFEIGQDFLEPNDESALLIFNNPTVVTPEPSAFVLALIGFVGLFASSTLNKEKYTKHVNLSKF
jgi:hypothetical protein